MVLFNKSKHKIEIGREIELTKAVRTQKTHSGFSPVRKFIGSLVALSVAATVALVGVTMMPTPGQETAQADWLTDLVCGNNESPDGIYGGSASTIDGARNRTAENIATDTSRPWEALIGVPVPDAANNLTAQEGTRNYGGQMTVLERYGYFQPTFESWKGLAAVDPNNGDNPAKAEGGQIWFGSGGSSSLTGVGPGVIIKDIGQSAMFSDNVALCFQGLFGVGQTANILMTLPKFAIAIASTVYMMTSNLSLTGDSMLAPIGDVIEVMILGDGNNEGLKDLLFLDFMLVMIMLGGIVVAWQGLLKGQIMQAVQSAVWMLLVGVTGILFLSNPLWISSTMEKGLDIVETAIESATLQTSTMSPECDLPNGDYKATERKISCSLWLNSIYKPWVNGQFGKDYKTMIEESDVAVPDPSIARDWVEPMPASMKEDAVEWFSDIKESADNGVARGEQLETAILNSTLASAGSRGVFDKMVAQKPLGTKNVDNKHFKNWAYYQLHSQSNWDAATGVNISEVAYNQLVLQGNIKWRIAMDSIPNSLLALLASAAPTVFMLIIGGTLISFQIILVVLIIMAPFFFTLGFFPGWGRRILMRWCELMVSLFLKRVILVLFLFIFLKIYISILELDIAWAFQILFITILTIVALTQKDQVTQMITSQVNFGSYNSFGSEESMKQSAVAGVVGGYYAGKAGSRAVGNLANKFKRRPGSNKNKNNNNNNSNNNQGSETTDPSASPVVSPNGGPRGGGSGGGGGSTPPPLPPPEPTSEEVAPITPPPGGGSTQKPATATAPEDWEWQHTHRDKDGNLITAARYNEDGTGKAYHNGETYNVMTDENGKKYATRDRDGKRLDPETLQQLNRKRDENADYARVESQQKEIEAMPKDSAEYTESRAQRAKQREANRGRQLENQQQASIEAGNSVKTSSPDSASIEESRVTGPARNNEDNSPPSQSSPASRRGTQNTSPPEIVVEYDPATNTYITTTQDDNENYN